MAMKASKRYRNSVNVADLTQEYSFEQAIEYLRDMVPAKFDETVEIAGFLGVDPKQGDQMVRGVVSLPHGSGQKVRVLVFTENPQEALSAGADLAGLEDVIKKIEEGWMDFDVAIATTSAMKTVRTLARILGPRGLMPNPRSGTVTDSVQEGIQAVKAGRVEFKMDKTANVAIVIGKRSFDKEKLVQNAMVAYEALLAAKPANFRGTHYVRSLSVSSTMSPAIKVKLSASNK